MTEHVGPESHKETEPQYLIDPEDEKRVLRKLDRVILPLMALVYFFQYLDKQSINYAAIFGLQDDLSLTGTEFSWAISLFYFGQFCSEYPAAYLMSRLPITRFVGATIVLWGVTEMCLGATADFPSLGAVRFLLGFTEGAVSPSFMIITSNWYKRSENPVRIATWVSMFGVSQIAGALMMYGIGTAGDNMDIESWRVMFLVCGGLTVGSGILFLVIMPRDATTAWFLNEEERRIATERLALDRATRDRAEFNRKQAQEALTDPRFYHHVPSVSRADCLKFSSKVIHGFGYSSLQTMLVGLPGGAIAFVLVWVGAMGPLYFDNARCFFGMFLALMPLLGSLLLLLLTQPWGIVVSTWFAGCTAPPLGQVVGLMASNVKGNTKKSVNGAVFFVFYCVGCIVGPQLWQAKDAPHYRKGCIASIASYACLILSLLTYYLSGVRSNRKRDGEDDFTVLSADEDLTEREDRAFRFTL
ncbi:putative transporter [Lasiodiplodia hormozganensis]|uniref:Transporter n=1 Tax=Lasiodiplodia hormozganensis TaxID=869390 RepID=A0AA39XTP5_9PEZI|nr:putative transporter [Lasiodiplodia hormozganensis]